jgi:hypothetical protein
MNAHFFASSVLKSRYVMIPAVLHPWIATMQTTACQRLILSAAEVREQRAWTASRKKLRLKPGKARMYLFATVIMIDDAQYEMTGKMGLFCQLLDCGVYFGAGGDLGGLNLPCSSPNSISFPSKNLFLSSSAILLL